jgi:hypothetical protein
MSLDVLYFFTAIRPCFIFIYRPQLARSLAAPGEEKRLSVYQFLIDTIAIPTMNAYFQHA